MKMDSNILIIHLIFPLKWMIDETFREEGDETD